MTDPQPTIAEHMQPRPEDLEAAAAAAAGPDHHHEQQHQRTPAFAPIYTLVNNSSTRTTHHPRVLYIFSDDDPDRLTEALAQQHDANLGESASGPAPDHRAILLDLAQDAEGGYSVAWSSSLSPSWAVLDAQVSRISPPSSSSDGEGSQGQDSPSASSKKKPDRLMLRIEGVEGGSLGSEGELKLSGDKSGHSSGTGTGSGSGQKDRESGHAEDYGNLVDEFDKRMNMLRKVVDAGEERLSRLASEATQPETHAPHQDDINAPHPKPPSPENLRRYADDG
ncbi:uncharacterized protein JN550_009945 [Neoarthrinium moseri]|uniref:uncharacterized protein n=1 Tax=Neoarthrinium moseri TaxID=1658444 RepID=UPI001FDBC8E7|nr:uncharacterized protein JN550_009945 [Neoarthrinium moseri]KAI1862798.1 hypothetical protein JN550_009945 [Neoarthrinium moseri]